VSGHAPLFGIVGLVLISFGIVAYWRHRSLGEGLSPLERIGWTVGTMAGLAALLYWLVPEMPIEGKIIVGFPMLLLILAAVIWPERKGMVWPYNNKTNRRARFVQRWVIVLTAYTVFWTSSLLFSKFFPVPSYLQAHASFLIPSSWTIPSLELAVVLAVVLFLIAIWHHIRSLSPKSG
jgi:hypothetical protein